MQAGWEFVLWALFLAGVLLWNVLKGLLRRRPRLGDRLPPEVSEVPHVPEAQQPLPQPWGRAPAPEPQVVPEPWGRRPLAEAPGVPLEVLEHAREVARTRERRPPAVAQPRTTRWRTRAEVRRAFVDAAVLGPPRALEPWTGQQDTGNLAAGRQR